MATYQPKPDRQWLPVGGTGAQVLAKASSDNYDVEWVDTTPGGSGAVNSVNTQTGTVVLDTDDISDVGATRKYTTTADIGKLLGIAIGATANDTDAALRARASHTGTQILATISDVTATAAELNALDGITATVTELNYTDGVTSAIQTQIDGKEAVGSVTTHAAVTATHGATGAVVGTTNTQTLTNKTLTTPTIADFTNAGHDHLDADDGGTLSATAIASGTVATARLGSGTADATTFLRGDQTYATPPGAGGGISDVVDDPTPQLGGNLDLNTFLVGTASAADLAKLVAVTATDVELNLLDGVTASTAELNLLDGVTSTTTELNYTDGVTSAIQTQLNAKEASGSVATHAAVTATHGATGAVVGTTNTQTLTGKTLTAPVIADFTSAGHTHANAAGGGTIAHTALTSIGTNTHAQIDTHLANVSNPHATTAAQVGAVSTAYVQTFGVTYIINDGGTVLATGRRAPIKIPFGYVIAGWDIAGDQSGSIVIDLWNDTAASYPPTVADTITAAAKPTVAGATRANSTTLTGWTTSFAADRYLMPNVDSCSSFTWVALTITMTRTI